MRSTSDGYEFGRIDCRLEDGYDEAATASVGQGDRVARQQLYEPVRRGEISLGNYGVVGRRHLDLRQRPSLRQS